MEEDLEKISDELVKASGMHKSQADRIDKLLERKDNKSIAKSVGVALRILLRSGEKSVSHEPSRSIPLFFFLFFF